MTNDTERLIHSLAENVAPLRPLAQPWIRTAIWLTVSLPYLALVLWMVIILPNGLPPLALNTRFVIEIAAGLAVAIAAAAFAFGSVIPGYNRRFPVLLLMLLAIWLGCIGQSCIQQWLQDGSQALSLRHDLSCFPFIAFLTSYPVIVLVVMLRRGAPLTPHLTAALGGIAAAGLGNVSLRLAFTEDVNLGLFVWHIGGVFLLATLAGIVGNHLMNWRSITGASRYISR